MRRIRSNSRDSVVTPFLEWNFARRNLESKHFRSVFAMPRGRDVELARDYVAESGVTLGEATTSRATSVIPNETDCGRSAKRPRGNARADMQILFGNRSRSPLSARSPMSVSGSPRDQPYRNKRTTGATEPEKGSCTRSAAAHVERSLHVGVLLPDFPVIIESRRSSAIGGRGRRGEKRRAGPMNDGSGMEQEALVAKVNG